MQSALDVEGYVVLPRIASDAELQSMRDAFERRAGDAKSGTRHIDDLSDDPAFANVRNDARVLDAARHILRRGFRVSQFTGRDPLPGFGKQGLHADSTPIGPNDPWEIVTAIFYLDDTTALNGATRIVPRSHTRRATPPKRWSDPQASHPDEIFVATPAGSTLVFNGHLWHSGTMNRGTTPRRAVLCLFAADDVRRYARVDLNKQTPDHGLLP